MNLQKLLKPFLEKAIMGTLLLRSAVGGTMLSVTDGRNDSPDSGQEPPRPCPLYKVSDGGDFRTLFALNL